MTLTKREIQWALGAGALSSLIPLFALLLMAVSPFLSMGVILFFPLPVYITYLSQGTRVGAIASLVGAICLTISGNSGFLFLYAAIVWPAHVLCHKFLTSPPSEKNTETTIIQWFSLFILGLCLVGCLLYSLIDLKEVSGLLAQVKSQFDTLIPNEMSKLERLIPFLPVILALNVASLHVINAALAHLILKQKDKGLSRVFSLQTITVPDFWMYGLAASGVSVLLLEGTIELFAMNVIFICMLPYWFVGLGTIKMYFQTLMPPFNKMSWGIYVLIFLIPEAHLIIVCLGLFEPWIRLRSRFELKLSS